MPPPLMQKMINRPIYPSSGIALDKFNAALRPHFPSVSKTLMLGLIFNNSAMNPSLSLGDISNGAKDLSILRSVNFMPIL